MCWLYCIIYFVLLVYTQTYLDQFINLNAIKSSNYVGKVEGTVNKKIRVEAKSNFKYFLALVHLAVIASVPDINIATNKKNPQSGSNIIIN